MEQVTTLPISEMAALIASRAITAEALTEAHIARIERLDPTYRAFVRPTFDLAREMARAADREIAGGKYRGPMHGIPIALKDAYDTTGIETNVCSRLLAGRVPQRDAAAWARLRDAGAVLLGKLECAELCLGGPSPDSMVAHAVNPWNPAYYAGGSSSGAAVALATGMCAGALGTDTGGSIRLPAAYCGIAGLKPTYGLVGLSGVFPLSGSLDHAGPMARSSLDCALMLDAMSGPDPADPSSAASAPSRTAAALGGDLSGIRIGYVRAYAEDPAVSAEQRAGTEAALQVLASLGAEVREVAMPDLRQFTICALTLMMSEAFAIHGPDFRARAAEVSEMTRARMTLGAFIRAEDYVRAQKKRRELVQATVRVMQDVDVLVYPAALGDPPPLGAFDPFYFLELPLITAPANVAGVPAISVRAGFSNAGLPMGVQITGRLFGDQEVLRVAHAYEMATPGFARLPL